MASIPIAIEIVCTSTLAVGSRRLAESKVIVARLSAIEELAGMTILCSDKTGTWLRSLQSRWPFIASVAVLGYLQSMCWAGYVGFGPGLGSA